MGMRLTAMTANRQLANKICVSWLNNKSIHVHIDAYVYVNFRADLITLCFTPNFLSFL